MSAGDRWSTLEADVALLARAVTVLLNGEGYHGRWGVEDFARLREVLDRRDPEPGES